MMLARRQVGERPLSHDQLPILTHCLLIERPSVLHMVRIDVLRLGHVRHVHLLLRGRHLEVARVGITTHLFRSYVPRWLGRFMWLADEVLVGIDA